MFKIVLSRFGVRIYGNAGSGSPLRIAWSDGPPQMPRFGGASGAFVAKLGEGFVLSTIGDASTTRRLVLYGGCCGSTCRMEASMSVGVAPLVREVVSTGGYDASLLRLSLSA